MKNKAANIREILEAGGIQYLPEIAERIQAIRQYSIDMVAFRMLKPRERSKIRQRRRRPGDPPRVRLVKRRGAPAHREMRELFGNLAGFWLDVVGEVPGVTFNDTEGTYSGRFVRFSQALCASLSDEFQHLGAPARVTSQLREAASNPVRVRTLLRAIRLPQFVTALSKSRRG